MRAFVIERCIQPGIPNGHSTSLIRWLVRDHFGRRISSVNRLAVDRGIRIWSVA